MEKFIPDPARLQAVEENWKRVLDRVQEGAAKSGRDPREVRLMAVTKTVEPVYINRALDLGLVNKSFDDFERQLVRDVIRTRLPETLRREDVFD